MKLIKRTLRNILGQERYYRWLTVIKVRVGILRSGILTFGEFQKYTTELNNSTFLKEVLSKRRKFHEVKQKIDYEYSFAAMDLEGARNLYCLLRKYQPEIVVETGVYNGFSTSFILQALHLNQKGKLYSIEILDEKFFANSPFWDNLVTGPAQAGWIIPEALRERWDLRIGDSRNILPTLLQELKRLDVFIHDGLHTYENMMFEFQQSYEYLTKSGLIVSDDINWNTSLFDFAQKIERKVIDIGGGVGLIVK